MSDQALKLAVLISGNGSNLQALIDASAQGAPFTIEQVISNRPNAYGLVRAAEAGITQHCIDHQDFADRESFERALIQQIDQSAVDWIVLAGFMRRLTPQFVQHYPQRILNIHPSLLPKYPGLNTHQRAIDAGDRQHGVSVHIVTNELDQGPILAQAHCDITATDTADSLKAKVHRLEHQLYPKVLSRLAQPGEA